MGIQQLIWAIAKVTDAFDAAVYSAGDLDAALALAAPDCVLENLPIGRGARDGEDLRRHLGEDVLPHLPADLVFRRLSRTADQRRLVDEVMVGFTHDRELPWLLPGAEPTHRHAEVLAISMISFRHTSRLGTTESRITSHRTLWDHVGLLEQLRLDPALIYRQ
jgi:carboxymethylenebutenolidase